MEYTKADYTSSSAPYAELYELRANAFEHQQRLEELAEDASSKGFRGFKKMYSEYTKTRKSNAWVRSYTSAILAGFTHWMPLPQPPNTFWGCYMKGAKE